MQKDENRDRQKDNTHDSEGFHPNSNQLRETNMNKYEPIYAMGCKPPSIKIKNKTGQTII